MPTIGWLSLIAAGRAVEVRVAEAEDAAVARDEPVAVTGRCRRHADDRAVERDVPGRAEVRRISRGEHAAVGRDTPGALPARRGGHADDRCVERERTDRRGGDRLRADGAGAAVSRVAEWCFVVVCATAARRASACSRPRSCAWLRTWCPRPGGSRRMRSTWTRCAFDPTILSPQSPVLMARPERSARCGPGLRGWGALAGLTQTGVAAGVGAAVSRLVESAFRSEFCEGAGAASQGDGFGPLDGRRDAGIPGPDEDLIRATSCSATCSARGARRPAGSVDDAVERDVETRVAGRHLRGLAGGERRAHVVAGRRSSTPGTGCDYR